MLGHFVYRSYDQVQPMMMDEQRWEWQAMADRPSGLIAFSSNRLVTVLSSACCLSDSLIRSRAKSFKFWSTLFLVIKTRNDVLFTCFDFEQRKRHVRSSSETKRQHIIVRRYPSVQCREEAINACRWRWLLEVRFLDLRIIQGLFSQLQRLPPCSKHHASLKQVY